MIQATFRTFNFRLLAVASGGAMEYTAPITIKAFNCDYQGPQTLKEKKIKIFENIDILKHS